MSSKSKSPSRFTKPKPKFGGKSSNMKASGTSSYFSQNKQEDMQSTLNEWMDKIEMQINQIEEKVYERALTEDFNSFEVRF